MDTWKKIKLLVTFDCFSFRRRVLLPDRSEWLVTTRRDESASEGLARGGDRWLPQVLQDHWNRVFTCPILAGKAAEGPSFRNRFIVTTDPSVPCFSLSTYHFTTYLFLPFLFFLMKSFSRVFLALAVSLSTYLSPFSYLPILHNLYICT